jgi:hypothetical protein
MLTRRWMAQVLALAVALGGCGQARFVPVEGTITVDGQPGKKLFIQFEPLAEGKNLYPGPGSVGRTDESGKYRLMTVPDKYDGAVVGKHMVRIFADGGPDDDELVLKGQSIRNRSDRPKQLPARYNNASELTFEVVRGGTNRANFTLSSK